MLDFLFAFLGGGIGASLRHFINLVLSKFNLPFATFGANIIGCFILGYIYSSILHKYNIPPQLKLFLTVGFLGGLTTFSTFIQENFIFLKDEKIVYFLLYTLLSLCVGLLFFYFGYNLAK